MVIKKLDSRRRHLSQDKGRMQREALRAESRDVVLGPDREF